MRYIIKSLTDPKKSLIVTEIYIDEDDNLEWGLKTTRDMKRHYWRIRGNFYYISNKDELRSKRIQFRMNLDGGDAIMGMDNTWDLALAIQKIYKNLQQRKVYYEKKSGGVFIDGRKKIEYEGWLELKVKRECKQSLFSLINRDQKSNK